MQFLLFFIVLLASTICSADIVTVDSSQWNQDQKNMSAAMSYQLLYKAGITFQKLNISLPTIEVVNPSAPVDTILTKQTIENEYASWKIVSDEATLAEQQKQTERNTELQSNTLKNVTLSQINTVIDNISNLSDAKIFLKKLVRYLDAKGFLDN